MHEKLEDKFEKDFTLPELENRKWIL